MMLSLIKPVYAVRDLSNQYAFGDIGSLGEGLGRIAEPAFALAATILVIMMLWGSFRYLVSGGDKNAIEAARNMIIHAIIGFILLLMLFLILLILPIFLFGQNPGYSIIKL